MNANDLRRKQKELLFPNVSTYYQEALPIESGKGMFLKDVEGREYLDFFGGILTVSVGHCHPRVTEAAIEQQKKLVHVSTLYPTLPQLELAEKLVQIKPMKEPAKVFFSNSGTEANDTAVTLAKEATGRTELVVLRHNYAGRGTLALSMMGNKNYRPKVQSEVPGIRFAHAPYCYRCDFGLTYPDCGVACAKDLKSLIETTTDGEIAALMVEPIQGVGGFITPPKEYFEIAVPIARAHGGLFIADEVQTAWGRTGGKWWGVEQFKVEPDILTSAKGMANGQPIGLTMAKSSIADKGVYAQISTFGASPISMAASVATLKVIEEEKLLFNTQMMGKVLREGLESLQQRFPAIGDVRGMGLMQGVELVKDRKTKEEFGYADRMGHKVALAGRRHQLLLRPLGNVVVLMPPLSIKGAEIDLLAEGVGAAIREATEGAGE